LVLAVTLVHRAAQAETVERPHLARYFLHKEVQVVVQAPLHHHQDEEVMAAMVEREAQVVLPNTKNPTPHSLRELRITTMYSLMEKVVTAHNSAVEQVGMVLLLAEATADNMEAAVVLMVAQPELADNMVAKVALVAQKA